MRWLTMGKSDEEEKASQLASINGKRDQLREVLRTSCDALGLCVERCTKRSDLLLFQQTRNLQKSHPKPLNRFGKKCFSQTDIVRLDDADGRVKRTHCGARWLDIKMLFQ